MLSHLLHDPVHCALKAVKLLRHLHAGNLIVELMDRLDVISALFDDIPGAGGKIRIRSLFSLCLLPEHLALRADILILLVDLFREHERRLLLIQPSFRENLLIYQRFDIGKNVLLCVSGGMRELGDVYILRLSDRFSVFIITLYQLVFFSSGGYPVGTRSNDERRCEYPEERACAKPACHKTRQASKEHRNSDHQSEYTSYDLSKSGLLADQLLEERRLAGRIPSLGLSGAVHPLSVTGIFGRPVSPVRIISIGAGAALACSTPVGSAAHILTAVLFVVIPNVSLDRIGNFLYSFSYRLAQVFEIIAVYGIVDRVHYFASCLI